ncbi:unnamed protein product [Triticum turgidum subsp. durum]|uniref:Transaldolase n=1 Tax=Triticum turgidum subsp. durum TaxID=4567 RepID=A0A9R0ZE20_TRITD|nr:unnamed protein product [Triticum turgidum subsp. durum]
MALSISAPTSSPFLPAPRQVHSLARVLHPPSDELPFARFGRLHAVVTELDVVSSFSEIVPDTVVFDDFEKFAPTAATVSSSLLLGIAGLPDTQFKSAIDTALVDGECNTMEKPGDRMSCYLTKALGNVGAELAHQVPGRVSTEIDARLAYDTQGIVQRVHELLQIYNEHDIPSERLLFKIPATWQGIEASRLLESEGTQTHLTFVYSFAQAAAAAQAGASVVQIFVGRIRDWAKNHSGDPEIDEALKKGEDQHKLISGNRASLLCSSAIFNVPGVAFPSTLL